MNDLSMYLKLQTLRNLLKDTQQISWDITQLDKKFPIDRAEEIGYEELLKAYLDFNDRIQCLAHEFREEVLDDPVIDQIKMKNKLKNETRLDSTT
jgi:hypothetical protein